MKAWRKQQNIQENTVHNRKDLNPSPDAATNLWVISQWGLDFGKILANGLGESQLQTCQLPPRLLEDVPAGGQGVRTHERKYICWWHLCTGRETPEMLSEDISFPEAA